MMRSDARLRVDDRWAGRHGIARFGREVLTRLRTPHDRLGGPSDPLSPFDLLNPRRLTLRSRDLVYSPGFNAGISRGRQLLTLHDLIHLEDSEERDRRKALYYERVVRPATLHAGRVLTVSPTSRDVVRRWLDDAIPVIDVGNGCSDEFFAAPLDGPRSGVLYVGNLKPHKNPSTAFAAVAATPGEHLTVVTGDRDSASALAVRHGIEERTAIRSSLTDGQLARLYGESTALLLPSLSEGFGLPAAEALAMGCPVIHWAGCASVQEIVERDGEAVGDVGDIRAWSDAIASTRMSEPRLQTRDRIQRRYSWDAVAARVDDVLQEMLTE